MKSNSLGRNILAVIVASIVCGVVIGVVEGIGHVMFPPPEGMDPYDPESIKKFANEIPTGAFAMVIVAWGIGAFCGGFLAAKLARSRPISLAMIVGVLFQLAGLFQLITIPSPVWMWIGGFLVFLPPAFGGAKLAGPVKEPAANTESEVG